FDMATGSGKSFMIYSLANLFIDCRDFTNNVLIVTPRIALVKQLCQEYQTFCEIAGLEPKQVIAISSVDTTGQEICNLESWKEESTIGVCCARTLENNPAILEQSSVVIIDEFHMVHNQALSKNLLELRKSGGVVLQFSATPPKDPLGELIFHYTAEDARR